MTMSRRNQTSCIVLFARWPTPGQVKTRLIDHLGAERSTRLYEHFIIDSLSNIEQLETELRIACCPAKSIDSFRQWLGDEYYYIGQRGSDLGRRMSGAFEDCFAQGFDSVILTEADCPDMPADYVRVAIEALQDCDAVLGPCRDGGFYLLGFRHDGFVPEALQQVKWASAAVFDQCAAVLCQFKKKLFELPLWYDVDVIEDLEYMIWRNRETEFRNSQTFKYLEQSQIIEQLAHERAYGKDTGTTH